MFYSTLELRKKGHFGYEVCPKCHKPYANIIHDEKDLRGLRWDDVCTECRLKALKD